MLTTALESNVSLDVLEVLLDGGAPTDLPKLFKSLLMTAIESRE